MKLISKLYLACAHAQTRLVKIFDQCNACKLKR